VLPKVVVRLGELGGSNFRLFIEGISFLDLGFLYAKYSFLVCDDEVGNM
jgi:hypothetical protein